ncbi:MAG: hypothetical protein M5U13_11775 [Thermoanaerobaculia bacterium]|nr:hypothetical protein [Thermoanaerobaculia bacterium]
MQEEQPRAVVGPAEHRALGQLPAPRDAEGELVVGRLGERVARQEGGEAVPARLRVEPLRLAPLGLGQQEEERLGGVAGHRLRGRRRGGEGARPGEGGGEGGGGGEAGGGGLWRMPGEESKGGASGS